MFYLIISSILFYMTLFAEEAEDFLNPSPPEQVAAIHSELLVGGILSPINGQLVFNETDLIAHGAQDIILTRYYSPPYMPASFHPKSQFDEWLLYSYCARYDRGWLVFPQIWLETEGSSIFLRESNGLVLHFIDGALATPHYGITNTSGETPHSKYDPRNIRLVKENDQIIAHIPDGTIRYYRVASYKNPRRIYLLQKEILSNGKVLRYNYNQGKLTHIESLDPKERYVYTSIHIEGSSNNGLCRFITHSGQTATYRYQTRHLYQSFRHHGHEKKRDKESHHFLTNVTSPYFDQSLDYNHRFLLWHTRTLKENFSLVYDRTSDQLSVTQIQFPVGPEDTYFSVFDLVYDLPIPGKKDGNTRVTRNDLSYVYLFSSDLLLLAIYYPGKDKIYHWTPNHWLSALEYKNLYTKSYIYDSIGNPIEETLTGNLTGEGEASYTIKKTYDRHLLLKEEQEDGLITTYTYLPGTDLITSKMNQDIQEVREYDDCNNLVQIRIQGDGESHETHYLLRQEHPFLHLPEWVEEKASGIILKKTHLLYDTFGNVCQEEIYDANGKLAYTLYKEYNERGDLLSETNPLGQKAIYTYDQHGRCNSSIDFSPKLRKNMLYDTRGRLKELKESTHTTFYSYDPNDYLSQKTDPYHQSTHYTYDPLTQKVNKTVSPLRAISYSTYNPLGHETSKTDPNRYTTLFQYNTYGSPVEIIHPDRGVETFRYYKNGKLKTHTDPDGLITSYTYDLQGRILSKRVGDAEETFTYNAFHLLSKTDFEGNVTTYTYDFAGRKIREEILDRITEYTYDALGRVATLRQNDLMTHYQRDLLDRILEESKTDLEGNLLYKISYTYDEEGNQSSITLNEQTETFSYDPFHRLTEHRDACGAITIHTYLESDHLEIITSDPREITTIKTYDAHGKLCKEEIPNRSLKEYRYDLVGNLTEQIDQGQVTRYTYTPRNKIASFTRAAETPNERTTHYTYTPSGKLESKTLPDGITLFLTYTPLGYLASLTSSDGQIHHTFKYNRLGSLLQANDITRTLDPFGNILQENYPSGLTIQKTYDPLNRTLSIDIPDHAPFYFTYDPLYLRSVATKTHLHTYTTYNLGGDLTSESMIDDLGEVDYLLDPSGRVQTIQNPYFIENYIYDFSGNLIQSTQNTYSYDDLSQLISENDSTYCFDANYNRIEKEGTPSTFNQLNEDLSLEYDLNGNLIRKDDTLFTYDPLGQLIRAITTHTTIEFTYDPLGRILSKTISTPSSTHTEYYLYNGQEEIATYTQNGLQALRVPGIKLHPHYSKPAMIELEGQILAPLLDAHNHIRALIDPSTKELLNSYTYSAFGELTESHESHFNPFRYSSKRFDPDLNLIWFGKRFYSPELARWLTPDPAGFKDSTNLYQYLFNNPFSYIDPDGQFAFLIPLFALFAGEATLTSIITYATLATAALIGAEWAGHELSTSKHSWARNLGGVIGATGTLVKAVSKIEDVYAPDRELPMTEHGVPIPETDAPHTELGKEEGRRGKYPKAREFDKNGKPLRDIEFTDHGRPHDHTSPHQHVPKPNGTGGTPNRGDPVPVPGWIYL